MTEPVDPSTAPTESDALIASSSQFRVDSCVHYFKDEINGHVRFNLIKLRKEEGTYQDASAPGLEWNFCQFIAGTEYFASQASLDAGVMSLTSNDAIPSSTSQVMTGEEITGIQLTWDNDESQGSCDTSSFTAIVNCADAVT